MRAYRRGFIYWMNFGKPVGHIQSKHKTGIIVQSEAFFQEKTILAVPSSDASSSYLKPYIVYVPQDEAGLSEARYFLCHQLHPVNTSDVGEEVGALPPHRLAEIEMAILSILGMLKKL